MLGKKQRLKRSADFHKIYKSGRRITEKHLQLFHLHNTKSPQISRQNLSRFGFVVSKKAAPKIQRRNRIKRILRGLVRLRLGDFFRDYDYIFQARRGIGDLSKAELTREFDGLVEKLRATP